MAVLAAVVIAALVVGGAGALFVDIRRRHWNAAHEDDERRPRTGGD